MAGKKKGFFSSLGEEKQDELETKVSGDKAEAPTKEKKEIVSEGEALADHPKFAKFKSQGEK